MSMKVLIASTSVFVALASISGSPAAASTPALVVFQQAGSGVVAGTWTGQFGGADWIFELKRENEIWVGRYMIAGPNNWHELRSLIVSGRSVSFSIESKPTLSFSLTADEQGQRLEGSVIVPSGMAAPFSATRRP